MATSPIRAGVELVEFFRIAGVPVFCNVLWPTAEEARQAARGDIELAHCPETALVFNTAFDPSLVEYSPDYETSLHFSPRFQEYAEKLVARLVATHDLRDKDVLEIGCGKAEFLDMLCRAGDNRGVGFDTSYESHVANGAMRIERRPFDANATETAADFLYSRHVLEHVAAPLEFLAALREAATKRSGARVFCEVPNALWTLRDLGVWDVIYEHVAYYTPVSLERAFQAAGFRVDDVWTDFGDQFLCLEATPDAPSDPAPDERVAEAVGLCRAFGEQFEEKQEHWRAELADLARASRTVALWGAGSKGVTFLNTVDDDETIRLVVDLNPRKQGRFVPGTAQPVIAPEALRERAPDVVLVMNPLYRSEIEVTCRELRIDAEVRSV